MRSIIRIISLILVLLTSVACVQRLEPVQDTSASHSVRLFLEGGVQPYDAEAGTKAAAAIDWKSGDRIYIRTMTTSGASTSYAQREADGSWTLNYTGTLSPSAAAQCVFFQKAKGSDAYSVSLSYNSIIYEDTSATLAVGDGSVTLSTYLKPKTGRISFHGGTATIGISKLAWYTSFDLETFEFTECANANVSSFATGSGKYFYGFFSEDNPDREIIISTDGLVFKRSFGSQVLRSGASGYIDVPTHTDYTGWTLTNESELEKYQSIEIEDPNFKAWLVERFDKDDDGEISKAEGEKVYEISNEGNNTVKSLKGIEHFPNLRTLRWTGTEVWDDTRDKWVGNGLLTQVDISHNTALVELDLGYNQLSAIDLTNNSMLKTLRLRRNQFSTLDLSSVPSLEVLSVDYNLLTSLNVSVCLRMKELSAEDNKLSSIDVSNLTALVYLDLNENYSISSLDVSACVKLQGLHVRSNKLSTLDLSGCPNLTALNIGNNEFTSFDFSICSNLDWLSCHDNHFTSLDVSVCPKLKHLNCWSTPGITYLDLSMLDDLEELFCANCSLTSLDLVNNTKLRYLECQGNNLRLLDISNCSKMTRIYCWENDLTVLDVTGLPELQDLRCAQNDFSGKGLDVSHNAKLRYLYCNEDNLHSLDVSSNPLLWELGCYSNPIGPSLDVSENTQLMLLEIWNCPYLDVVYLKAGQEFQYGISKGDNTEIVYLD